MLMCLLHKISSMTPESEKQGTKNKQTKNICSLCSPSGHPCHPNLEREPWVSFVEEGLSLESAGVMKWVGFLHVGRWSLTSQSIASAGLC